MSLSDVTLERSVKWQAGKAQVSVGKYLVAENIKFHQNSWASNLYREVIISLVTKTQQSRNLVCPCTLDLFRKILHQQ